MRLERERAREVGEKAKRVLSFLAEITENPVEGYIVLQAAVALLEQFFFETSLEMSIEERKEMSKKAERRDTAHDFHLYEREDGKIVWKCLYCGVEVEDFDEMWERQDEPCEP